MKKLVINADDFGLCDSVNAGIIECITNGIVSDLSFIINPPFLNNSIELLRKHSIKNIGVHLNFTMGKPLSSEFSTLTDFKGNFNNTNMHFLNHLKSKINSDEIYEEGKTQIETLITNGFTITHFDTHQNIHTLPPFFKAINQLRKVYFPDAYLRIPYEHAWLPINYKFSNWKRVFILNSLSGFLTTKIERRKCIQTIGGDFFNNENPDKVFRNVLKKINSSKQDSFEMAVHPGLISNEISDFDPYIEGRKIEFDFLSKSNSFPESYGNIKIINFNELVIANNFLIN